MYTETNSFAHDHPQPQGSPSDRGGGSSSTPPPSDRDSGSSSTPPGAGSQPEVIEVDDGRAVLVLTPALARARHE